MKERVKPPYIGYLQALDLPQYHVPCPRTGQYNQYNGAFTVMVANLAIQNFSVFTNFSA